MYTNSAAGSVKRMKYYVPIQENQPNAHASSSTISSQPRRIRILGRRYGLTSTFYKYLDIGISVGSASSVEIVLGDNRGHHLILSHQTWKELQQKRTCVDRLLQSPDSSPIWIRDLSITGGKMQNIPIVKFSTSNTILYFTRDTVNMLFNLELCINHMYAWLCENVPLVDSKFRDFVNVLHNNNIIGERYSVNTVDWSYVAQVIRDSDIFDSDSLIDCELLACALPDILYDALRK